LPLKPVKRAPQAHHTRLAELNLTLFNDVIIMFVQQSYLKSNPSLAFALFSTDSAKQSVVEWFHWDTI